MNTQIEFVEALQSRFAIEHVKDNLKVNLTQMALPYGRTKRPGNWLKTTPAQEYLKVVFVATKIATKDLIQIKQSGNSSLQGTWCIDYHIALRFAQWLSPEFSYVVDDLVLKLLTQQATIAEPFNGIDPVIHQNKPWYYYREVLRSIGFSINSGSVAKRKKEHPDYFVKLFGRNFINLSYCHSLQDQALKYGIQLRLSFANTDIREQVIMIPDSKLRMNIYAKMKRGGLI